MPQAVRFNLDCAITRLYYLLDDGKSQPYARAVKLSGPLQLAKAGEKFREVLCCNTGARIFNLNFDKLLGFREAGLDFNLAFKSEFDRVPDQVNDNLFQTLSIANQSREHLVFCSVDEANSLCSQLGFKCIANEVECFIGIKRHVYQVEHPISYLA